MRRLLSAFVILALWAWGIPAQAESIVVTNGEWPPYFSEAFKYGGVSSRIAREAFAHEGVTMDYIFLPWKRSLEMTRHGTYDGALGWREDPDRERDFYYSDTIVVVDEVFFHKKGSTFDWQTLDGIGQYRIGGTLSYSHVNVLKSVIEKHGGTLDIAATDESNFFKLLEGRIDLFPCAKEVGCAFPRNSDHWLRWNLRP